ncbi:hypothetical protein B0H66DRAFT_19522 [Apodospora peruviana]|uniref:Aminoglycoside phosphotransferase domain-containing protein n=1 Tax=Apodospora peruviana TaxID=516989 RepID=A0AAE0IQI4_9PEZI|nr:hypothetical protein B0H66DRAFT_19522 [Apodospora peruviana]
MYDELIDARNRQLRDEFVNSIKDRICALSSSYHGGDDCEFFREHAMGSFNICFFVQFFQCPKSSRDSDAVPDGDRWVVRVPLGPRLAMEPWEKVESEVTTMRLVKSRTTIPIPEVYFYSTACEPGPYGFASFMIMEYVPGKNLRDLGFKLNKRVEALPPIREKILVQVANIYADLTRLEFPAIGRLVPGDGDEPKIGRMPISLCMNQQELEVGGTLAMVREHAGGSTGITSTDAYVSLLLDIAQDLSEKSTAIYSNEKEAKRGLYFLDQFTRHVRGKWTADTVNSDLFVLMHGDMQNPANLLFDDYMNLLAVLYWEWAQTVPRKLFLPPIWLLGRPEHSLMLFYDDYIEKPAHFCLVLDEVEKQNYGEVSSLSRDWRLGPGRRRSCQQSLAVPNPN